MGVGTKFKLDVDQLEMRQIEISRCAIRLFVRDVRIISRLQTIFICKPFFMAVIFYTNT